MATVCRFHRLFLLGSPLRQCSKIQSNVVQNSKFPYRTLIPPRSNLWPVRSAVRSFAESVKTRPSSAPRKATNGAKKPTNGNNTKNADEANLTLDEELAKLGLYQRYKKLALEYWYVLVPVHAGLSCVWFGSCYLFARSGIDIDLVGIMEKLNFPDVVIKPLRSPSVGYLAVSLALYKIVSPLRYLSTVALAVPVIKLLVRMGKIKPVPSREKIKRLVTNRIRRKRGEK